MHFDEKWLLIALGFFFNETGQFLHYYSFGKFLCFLIYNLLISAEILDLRMDGK